MTSEGHQVTRRTHFEADIGLSCQPPLIGGHRTDFECYFRYRLTAADYRLGPHSLVLPECSAIEMR